MAYYVKVSVETDKEVPEEVANRISEALQALDYDAPTVNYLLFEDSYWRSPVVDMSAVSGLFDYFGISAKIIAKYHSNCCCEGCDHTYDVVTNPTSFNDGMSTIRYKSMLEDCIIELEKKVDNF